MNGKKKLSGWQFGVLVALLVLMLSTMFMPLFGIDGKTVEGMITALNKSMAESLVDLLKDVKQELTEPMKEWAKELLEKELDKEGLSISDLSQYGYDEESIDKMIDESIDESLEEFNIDEEDIKENGAADWFEYIFDTKIDKTEKGYNDFIKIIEKNKGIKLSNITPLYIMTHSYSRFIGSDSKKDKEADKKSDQEDGAKKDNDSENTEKKSEEVKDSEKTINSDSLEKVYNSIRIILIAVYVICVLVLALTIAGFAANWSKTLTSAIDIIYGCFATAMFIVIRSTTPKIFVGIADSIKNMIGKEIIRKISDEFAQGLNSADFVIPQNIIDTANKVYSGFELKNLDTSGISSSIVKFGFIFAIVVAAVIIVFSIICLFVGGKELYVTRYMPEFDDTSEGFYKDDYVGSENKSINPFGDNSGGSGAFGTAPIVTPPVEPTPIVTPPVNPIPAQPQPVFQAPPIVNNAVGKVVCTKGVAYGQGFQLPVDRKVVVGKSPSKANLVINNQNVSNIHCSIRYNAARNTYTVKDHSSNGTCVNGVRMVKDVALEYPAGTVLSLADGSNEITLG